MLLGLSAALAYTAFVLAMRRAQAKHGSASSNLAFASVCTAVVLGAYLAVTNEPMQPASLTDAGWLVAYGLGSQVFAWVLITGALPHVPASRVGLLLLAQPVLSFVWDALFFSRTLSPIQLAGATLAIGAIYLGSRPVVEPTPRTVACE